MVGARAFGKRVGKRIRGTDVGLREIPQKSTLAWYKLADLMRAVREYKTGYFCRIRVLICTNEDAANRCADEYVRAFYGGLLQQNVQIRHSLFNSFVRFTRLAPSETSTIVRTHPRD